MSGLFFARSFVQTVSLTSAAGNLQSKSMRLSHAFQIHRRGISGETPNKPIGRHEKPLVYVGMSGGVDSSVAALLLVRKGFRVEGVYMKNWDSSDEVGEQTCPINQDLMDVKAVCEKIGIKYHMVDFVKEYWNDVFDKLLRDYSKGITPNPDVFCNSRIKFHKFLQYATSKGADYIATGHYAQIELNSQGQPELMKGMDPTKDQSYFLSRVPSSALKKSIFPVGHLLKSEVKKIAEENGLHNAFRKESMGICFVGKKKKFSDFLASYIPNPRKGVFQSIDDGRVLGRHDGAIGFTQGQKAKIPGMVSKYYVVDKDFKAGVVYVGADRDHPALYCDELTAGDVFWISGSQPEPLAQTGELTCEYQTRYHQDMGTCTIRPDAQEDGQKKRSLHVRFRVPQRAVTSGQIIVFYQGKLCLGSAIISKAGSSYFDQQLSLPPEHIR